ncbi:MerR family DNA-binding transcriptional regulator [Chimaeribacter arupi]|nr:MerR family DNA-binding transcriptional regulator [Chimaeribacter arupi]PLR50420.1 MerR family DNA-binding transcriptional regulator [Chimaeribacter arupi]
MVQKTPIPLKETGMALYSIDVVAQLCGVNPVTLRSWQRHGLLKPQQGEDGKRRYSDSDLSRAHIILHWVSRGVPLTQIRAILTGDAKQVSQGWQAQQEALLYHLEHHQTAKLRHLLWRYGREIPSENLVNDILRPLRLFLSSGRQSALLQQRAMLDVAIMEYASFAMHTARKRPGAPVLLLAWQVKDSLELWLEAIRLVSEGLRVELLPYPLPEPELERYQVENFFIWSDKPLTVAQQVQFDAWLAKGLAVMLVGAAATSVLMAPANALVLPAENDNEIQDNVTDLPA